MTRARGLLAALGVLAGLYGAYLLLSRQDTEGNVAVAIWLAGGVVLHDFLLVPLVLLVLAIGARVVPAPARAAVVAGLVVLLSVTLLAVPVLGRFGARSDNVTLLDRDYGLGWLALAGLVLLAVAVATLVRARHVRGTPVEAAEPRD